MARQNSVSSFNKAAPLSGKGINAPMDAEGRTALHISAEKGDIDSVAALLKRRANPHQPDKQGQTPIYAAIKAQNIVLVRLLLEGGATFQVDDQQKRTPLMWAIEQGCSVAFLKNLTALGLPLALQSSTGCSGLHTATALGRFDIIDYLIAAGLSPDTQDWSGKTAVHLAVDMKAHDALRRLLARGANPAVSTIYAKTPLYIAAESGDAASVGILLADLSVRETINNEQTKKDGLTALHAAVHGNHIAIAKKLIAHGAAVNQENTARQHSLAIAIQNGHKEMATLLIQSGADVRETAQPGQTPKPLAHQINRDSYLELLALLYAAGMDLNALNNYGQTALHLITGDWQAAPDRVKALLDLGADPNVVDIFGQRPLDIAMNGHISEPLCTEIIRELLNHGAKTTISPAPNMQTAPLHMAARSGMKEVVRLLIMHNAIVDDPDRTYSGSTPFLLAVRHGHDEVARMLLQKGASILKKDSHLRGALHLAAQAGSKEFLGQLLATPALRLQINAPDNSGMTPLHYACGVGKGDAIRLLAKNGGNLSAYDAAGDTPVHHALSRNYEDFFSIFEPLIKSPEGWNILQRDTGETLLHVAARNMAQPQTIERLLQLVPGVTTKDKEGLLPLYSAIKVRNIGAATVLINHMKLKKINFDQHRDSQNNTALHCAVRHYRQEVVQPLLEGGAGINAINADGDTPLHIAVRLIQADMVDFLVSHGADVEARNAAGETPLSIVLAHKDPRLTATLTAALQKKPVSPAAKPSRRPSTP